MLWIYLIALLVLFFAGLLYLLWYVLTRKISTASGDLHKLSQDYAAKTEEANALLQNAQKEAKAIVAKETQAAQELREKMLKEAQDQKERILKEASQKGLEIAEKAQRNADFLRKEVEQKINERAKEMVQELIQKAIPEEFLRKVHEQWMNDSQKALPDFRHLKIPEGVSQVKIISAFDPPESWLEEITKKLKKKTGAEAAFVSETDPALIAGFTVTIGSVVIDASLRHTIQKSMQNDL